MNHRLRRAAVLPAVVACLALATASNAGAAGLVNEPVAAPRSLLTVAEESALAVAETTSGWCIRGATFAVLFSAAFAAPAMVTGIGAPYTAARAGAAALAGCGVAVTWRTAARGVAWLDELLNPPPPMPASPVPVLRQPGQGPLIRTSG